MPRPIVLAEELDYHRDHIQEAIRKDGLVCLDCGSVYLFDTSATSRTTDHIGGRW